MPTIAQFVENTIDPYIKKKKQKVRQRNRLVQAYAIKLWLQKSVLPQDQELGNLTPAQKRRVAIIAEFSDKVILPIREGKLGRFRTDPSFYNWSLFLKSSIDTSKDIDPEVDYGVEIMPDEDDTTDNSPEGFSAEFSEVSSSNNQQSIRIFKDKNDFAEDIRCFFVDSSKLEPKLTKPERAEVLKTLLEAIALAKGESISIDGQQKGVGGVSPAGFYQVDQAIDALLLETSILFPDNSSYDHIKEFYRTDRSLSTESKASSGFESNNSSLELSGSDNEAHDGIGFVDSGTTDRVVAATAGLPLDLEEEREVTEDTVTMVELAARLEQLANCFEDYKRQFSDLERQYSDLAGEARSNVQVAIKPIQDLMADSNDNMHSERLTKLEELLEKLPDLTIIQAGLALKYTKQHAQEVEASHRLLSEEVVRCEKLLAELQQGEGQVVGSVVGVVEEARRNFHQIAIVPVAEVSDASQLEKNKHAFEQIDRQRQQLVELTASLELLLKKAELKKRCDDYLSELAQQHLHVQFDLEIIKEARQKIKEIVVLIDEVTKESGLLELDSKFGSLPSLELIKARLESEVLKESFRAFQHSVQEQLSSLNEFANLAELDGFVKKALRPLQSRLEGSVGVEAPEVSAQLDKNDTVFWNYKQKRRLSELKADSQKIARTFSSIKSECQRHDSAIRAIESAQKENAENLKRLSKLHFEQHIFQNKLQPLLRKCLELHRLAEASLGTRFKFLRLPASRKIDQQKEGIVSRLDGLREKLSALMSNFGLDSESLVGDQFDFKKLKDVEPELAGIDAEISKLTAELSSLPSSNFFKRIRGKESYFKGRVKPGFQEFQGMSCSACDGLKKFNEEYKHLVEDFDSQESKLNISLREENSQYQQRVSELQQQSGIIIEASPSTRFSFSLSASPSLYAPPKVAVTDVDFEQQSSLSVERPRVMS